MPPGAAGSPANLPPGFRFHPTDAELIIHYLRNRAASVPPPAAVIADVDIYKFDPWDLPARAVFGDREWYFFSPRDRKYPNGVRPNRAAASGYWKATGTDKPIHAGGDGETIGVKKALVFYRGRPPKGMKTNWIMHEYRLSDSLAAAAAAAAASGGGNRPPAKFRDTSMRLDDWVLCRIYKKAAAGQHSPASSSAADDAAGDFSSGGNANDEVYAMPELFSHGGNPAAPPMMMPRPGSISNIFEDFTSFGSLFDSFPDVTGAAGLPSDQAGPSGASQFFITDMDDLGAASGAMNKRPRTEAEYIEQTTPKRAATSVDLQATAASSAMAAGQWEAMQQQLAMSQRLLNSHYAKPPQ